MNRVTRAIERVRFTNKVRRRPLNWYRHRSLEESDVLLATYPRSGTTWIRFLLYELLSGRPSEFVELKDGIPYVGQQDVARRLLSDGGRLIQSHETYLDADRRVIYVVRDPRSVVVSQYYWLKRRDLVTGSFDGFFDDWIRGRAIPWGTWNGHVEFWLNSDPARRGHLHLVRYEDLRSSTHEELKKMLDFLDVAADDDTIEGAIANNSVEKMREKEDRDPARVKAKNPEFRFVRSGSTGGWKQELNAAQQGRIATRFADTLARLGYAGD